MFIGILFTIIVSLSIGTFSLLTFFGQLRAHPRFSRGTHKFSFGLFWLLMGIIWYLIALADFFGFQHLVELSIVATYVFQVFVGFSLVIIAYFLNQVVLGGWGKRWFMGLYGILYFIFLYSLFRFGVYPRPTEFFTNQITSSEQALATFTLMFLPLLALGIRLFYETIMRRRSIDTSLYQFFLFGSASLIVLGIAAAPDEIGIVEGWVVTASRLVSLVSSIFAYIAVLALHEADELVI